jgi:predicted nucleotidyltransferase
MNKEIRKMLKTAPVLPHEVGQLIRKYGIVSGSRVFGGFNPDESDVDVILLWAKFPWKTDDMVQMGAKYSLGDYEEAEYVSLYAKVPHSKHIHNLLLMRDSRSYQRWVDATRWMVQMKKEIPEMAMFFKDKGKRIEMFEMLKMWEE